MRKGGGSNRVASCAYFCEVVYRIGKRYRQERENNPQVEYPHFVGQLEDLVDSDTLHNLPELIGEYYIDFNDGQGTHHAIRVYFDEGVFEAEGTPAFPNLFSLSSDVDQNFED